MWCILLIQVSSSLYITVSILSHRVRDIDHLMTVDGPNGKSDERAPLYPHIRRRHNRTSAALSSFNSSSMSTTPTTTSIPVPYNNSSEPEKGRENRGVIRTSIIDLIPSLLPQFQLVRRAQSISSSTVDFGSSVFETYTYYRELTEAVTDAEMEVVLRRLVQEWQFVGVSVRFLPFYLWMQRWTINQDMNLHS